MKRYVLDASAAVRLFLDQPGANEFTSWYLNRKMERCEFRAPGLLPYELANVLHREQGQGEAAADPEHARSIIRDVLTGVRLDPDGWARTWDWAGRLTAYDAAYLGLALATESTLITFDDHLAKVARDSVEVIGVTGLA